MHVLQFIFRFLQSFVSFLFASVFLFCLSLITYITTKKHFIPTSKLDVNVPLGLAPIILSSIRTADYTIHTSPVIPAYLVGFVNLTQYKLAQLDSRYHYQVELECSVPKSYINRQLGSFIAQILLRTKPNPSYDDDVTRFGAIIADHSRSIIFPYESNIIRIARYLLFLPLYIFYFSTDIYRIKTIIIERLILESSSYIELIQLNILPSTFQLISCQLHFHILDLTGLTYSFIYYPKITGVITVFVLFSLYMTFYLSIAGLTFINKVLLTDDKENIDKSLTTKLSNDIEEKVGDEDRTIRKIL
ncbi:unnamed protein product [Didymodactylos carnosus]|uniref:Seipin n=1 Tax=Didymodactylos carnosus TaxID=1234261 RepID=A0A814MVS0_9BILA|nr:unnamed protein product [Didymodactylos carnosus]CAF1084425.1 unnamed protein product [Didymodactylos carnosus]CAF3549473.1 unnamed protein product [Didymodactylos carnosus]CAF3850063.1 unnamed protein product [Didymodactylos carnosus]